MGGAASCPQCPGTRGRLSQLLTPRHRPHLQTDPPETTSWQAGSPGRAAGRWEARGVLRASSSPAWMGPGARRPGWLCPRGARTAELRAEQRSTAGSRLNASTCVWLHFSTLVLFVDSVLPARHLRAKACGPQERKIGRPPEDSHFPGKLRHSGRVMARGNTGIAEEVPALNSHDDLCGFLPHFTCEEMKLSAVEVPCPASHG